VHISLVPFVAQVNIGNRPEHMAWMDTAGTAPYNGELLEDRSIAFRNRTTTGANRTGSNCELISTMPYTNYPGPYRINWVRSGSRCYAFTPEGINYFTLYDLIPNVAWGGCVEARPEPYDISDDAPNPLNPATMFVPFFWLDTTDGYSNSYLTDTIGDITSATMSSSSSGGSNTQNQREARMFNVFKYRNQSASVTTNPPEARAHHRLQRRAGEPAVRPIDRTSRTRRFITPPYELPAVRIVAGRPVVFSAVRAGGALDGEPRLRAGPGSRTVSCAA